MKSTALTTLAIAVCNAAFAVSLPADWKYYQTIEIAETGLVKIGIPLETLDAARPDLSDLRIFDAEGREVPFRIERPAQVQPKVVPAENLQVAISSDETVLTVETRTQRPVDKVAVETPAEQFIKSVRVEGSKDGVHWEEITRNQPIFRQPGAAKTDIEFAPGAWAKLRVVIDDRRSLPLPVTNVTIRETAPDQLPEEPLDVTIIERDESPGQTRLTLAVPAANVTLAGLQIEAADPLFTRQVRLAYREYIEGEVRNRVLVQATIYRVALEGHPTVSELTFARDVVLPSRELILTIVNGDSPPLTITSIGAIYRPVFATWLVNRPGTFHFICGNQKCAAPQYDLATLPTDLKPMNVRPRTVTALANNPAYCPGEPAPDIPDIGTPIDLSKWRFRKRIELAGSGVQELELDPETLARAGIELEDLRVVRAGKQIPYLLERPSTMRSIVPQVEQADDPKRPGFSLWRIKLPYSGVPVTHLFCDTDAPFFERKVAVTEEVPDERGNLYTVTRAAATWQRTPEQGRGKLVLTLAPPTTDLLMLEIENGDNPPLDLKNFELRYGVKRIIFKSTTNEPIYLYYGNERATKPRYEIDLAARQLLAAPKQKAVLGPEEALEKGAITGGTWLSGRASLLFWIVLAGVVVALLVIIARLLPRSHQAGRQNSGGEA